MKRRAAMLLALAMMLCAALAVALPALAENEVTSAFTGVVLPGAAPDETSLKNFFSVVYTNNTADTKDHTITGQSATGLPTGSKAQYRIGTGPDWTDFSAAGEITLSAIPASGTATVYVRIIENGEDASKPSVPADYKGSITFTLGTDTFSPITSCDSGVTVSQDNENIHSVTAGGSFMCKFTILESTGSYSGASDVILDITNTDDMLSNIKVYSDAARQNKVTTTSIIDGVRVEVGYIAHLGSIDYYVTAEVDDDDREKVALQADVSFDRTDWGYNVYGTLAAGSSSTAEKSITVANSVTAEFSATETATPGSDVIEELKLKNTGMSSGKISAVSFDTTTFGTACGTLKYSTDGGTSWTDYPSAGLTSLVVPGKGDQDYGELVIKLKGTIKNDVAQTEIAHKVTVTGTASDTLIDGEQSKELTDTTTVKYRSDIYVTAAAADYQTAVSADEAEIVYKVSVYNKSEYTAKTAMLVFTPDTGAFSADAISDIKVTKDGTPLTTGYTVNMSGDNVTSVRISLGDLTVSDNAVVIEIKGLKVNEAFYNYKEDGVYKDKSIEAKFNITTSTPRLEPKGERLPLPENIDNPVVEKTFSRNVVKFTRNEVGDELSITRNILYRSDIYVTRGSVDGSVNAGRSTSYGINIRNLGEYKAKNVQIVFKPEKTESFKTGDGFAIKMNNHSLYEDGSGTEGPQYKIEYSDVSKTYITSITISLGDVDVSKDAIDISIINLYVPIEFKSDDPDGPYGEHLTVLFELTTDTPKLPDKTTSDKLNEISDPKTNTQEYYNDKNIQFNHADLDEKLDKKYGNTLTIIRKAIIEADVSIAVTGPTSPVWRYRENNSVSPGEVKDYAEFKVEVANAGPANAQDVRITNETLPAGVSGLEYSLDNTTWNEIPDDGVPIGDVAVNGSETVYFRAKVNENSDSNDKTVKFAANSTRTTDNMLNNNKASSTFSIVKEARISANVTTIDNTTGMVGDTKVFYFGVANGGPDAAEGVVATLRLPEGVQVIKTTAGSVQGGTLKWNVGRLEAGRSTAAQVTVRFTTEGSKSLIAGASSTTFNRNMYNALAIGGVNYSIVAKNAMIVPQTGDPTRMTGLAILAAIGMVSVACYVAGRKRKA